MSKEERQFLDELRNKSIEAAAEIMESLQRLKVLYDEITDDGNGNPLPRPRPADFFYRLARFEMEHAANVIRLGNSQAEMIFDHVRQLSRRTRTGAGGPATTQVVTLSASEKPNVYVGELTIKNPFETEADIRYEISPCRSPDGTIDEKIPPIKVTSDSGAVGAHRSSTITLELTAEVKSTLFSEITVYLVAEVERQVAKRAIRVRFPPKPEEKPPTTESRTNSGPKNA